MVRDVMIDSVSRYRSRGVLVRDDPSARGEHAVERERPARGSLIDEVAFIYITAPVGTQRGVLGAVSEPVVGRQLCGGASRCGRHSRDEIEHVPTEVLPGPAIMGGVAVGIVGEGRVGRSAPVGAGVGER